MHIVLDFFYLGFVVVIRSLQINSFLIKMKYSSVVALLVLAIFIASIAPSQSFDFRASKARLDMIVDAASSCSFHNFSFLAMNTSDWVGVDSTKTFAYFLRICGAVQNPYCLNNSYTKDSMICQIQGNDTTQVFSLAKNDMSKVAWSWTDPKNESAGVNFVTQTGDLCGGVARTVNGHLVCSSSSGSLSVVVGDPWHACVYNMTIPTPAVCVKGQKAFEF